jgi:hypothetical protein
MVYMVVAGDTQLLQTAGLVGLTITDCPSEIRPHGMQTSICYMHSGLS